MSLVVFPFKTEDPAVAVSNLEVAASHPRVSRVLAVGARHDTTFDALKAAAAGMGPADVEVIVQDRIGTRRPGKGDGMNTAIDRFLLTDEDRLHFYDADITNFDGTWIDGAEQAADQGHPIVRHYFPRASTDAMITWMVTRPLFAIGHPDSRLWRLRQPLGGEILLTRPVAEMLATHPFVRERSDWGVDTAITYAGAATGLPIYEHYVAGGKQHALYGSLNDIREMVVECFEAAAAVVDMPSPIEGPHTIEPERPAAAAVAHRVAYDVEATLRLLVDDWTPAEIGAAADLPGHLAEPLLGNLIRPTFAFMDAEGWRLTLGALLDSYRSDAGWQGIVFRLWVARVLAYTTSEALAGHSRAMEILADHVARCAEKSGGR